MHGMRSENGVQAVKDNGYDGHSGTGKLKKRTFGYCSVSSGIITTSEDVPAWSLMRRMVLRAEYNIDLRLEVIGSLMSTSIEPPTSRGGSSPPPPPTTERWITVVLKVSPGSSPPHHRLVPQSHESPLRRSGNGRGVRGARSIHHSWKGSGQINLRGGGSSRRREMENVRHPAIRPGLQISTETERWEKWHECTPPHERGMNVTDVGGTNRVHRMVRRVPVRRFNCRVWGSIWVVLLYSDLGAGLRRGNWAVREENDLSWGEFSLLKYSEFCEIIRTMRAKTGPPLSNLSIFLRCRYTVRLGFCQQSTDRRRYCLALPPVFQRRFCAFEGRFERGVAATRTLMVYTPIRSKAGNQRAAGRVPNGFLAPNSSLLSILRIPRSFLTDDAGWYNSGPAKGLGPEFEILSGADDRHHAAINSLLNLRLQNSPAASLIKILKRQILRRVELELFCPLEFFQQM
ncbi:hypothetical protein FB451DRAFT_1178599 [Mycena latifolia]|nr:hypothetical protein FB451DRAFT_1178599 [Mycena latifolia]